MAYEVIIAPSARRDLNEIVDYLLMESPSGAASFVRSFDRLLTRVGSYPHVGPESRRPLRAGLRRLALPPYVVFYQVKPIEVEILRVLHGARDLDEVGSVTD